VVEVVLCTTEIAGAPVTAEAGPSPSAVTRAAIRATDSPTAASVLEDAIMIPAF
jgi:hypothetical protein